MPRDFVVPETVADFAASAFGAAGVEWTRRLPTLVAECAACWSLDVAEPFADLSINYVAPATRSDGTPVVLKVCIPNREFETEIAALRLFDGRGSVRLLSSDESHGALLLERLQPGTPLSDVADDAQAMDAFASVVRRLHRPAPAEHSFPSIGDWVRGMIERAPRLIGPESLFPIGWIDHAADLFADLLSPLPPGGRGAGGDGCVLLHGDLHQMNVLRAEREPWLAIDPKGLIGEPVWETGPLLLNSLPPAGDARACRAVLDRRTRLLAAALGIPRERIVVAGIVRAVLSAFWSLESEGAFWHGAIAVAERLSEIGGHRAV